MKEQLRIKCRNLAVYTSILGTTLNVLTQILNHSALMEKELYFIIAYTWIVSLICFIIIIIYYFKNKNAAYVWICVVQIRNLLVLLDIDEKRFRETQVKLFMLYQIQWGSVFLNNLIIQINFESKIFKHTSSFLLSLCTTLGIIIVSHKEKLELLAMLKIVKENALYMSFTIFGMIFIVYIFQTILNDHKYVLLLGLHEKNKIKTEYQSTLEHLHIGIITSDQTNLTYFNTKGMDFLKETLKDQQNVSEHLEVMN